MISTLRWPREGGEPFKRWLCVSLNILYIPKYLGYRMFCMLLVLIFPLYVQAKPIEIVLWHSLAGQLGAELMLLSKGFNESQRNYLIKPVYKGDYSETLTSFAAAFSAKQPPDLVQIFEVGTDTMLVSKGIIKPVDQVMAEHDLTLAEGHFFSAVRDYYSERGHLMAMPLNISVPVLYYNADLLNTLGYSADNFPKTWDELEVLASKLKHAGFSCAYTTTYPAWILIESFSAIHGLSMVDPQTNKASYNHQAMIHHLNRLRRWQKEHYFVYGGRSDDATVLFTSGQCPVLSQSSGAYASLAQLVSFRVGVAAIPLDLHVSQTRFNNLTGGAALWVVAGKKNLTYRGIAHFFNYLAQAEVQKQWHLSTGYLPLGAKGIYDGIAQLSQHPALAIALMEWSNTSTKKVGIRSSAQHQMRVINDEALEMIFAGIHPPQVAMDDAVRRSNQAIDRFLKRTSNL